MQEQYTQALDAQSMLTEIEADKAFWQKAAAFVGSTSDNTRFYFAIARGVLLEVLGLSLIAQATTHNRLKNAPVPVANPAMLDNEDNARSRLENPENDPNP